MFLLFTTFWACSLIRVSLIRVCSLPRECFSTPKGLHVSRRGGLKPLMHPSAWNRNSANFASTEFSEVRKESFKSSSFGGCAHTHRGGSYDCYVRERNLA